MATRTVQIKGMGFGSNPADITVTLDGNIVYSGTVTTQDSLPWVMPNFDLNPDTAVLCSFDIDTSFTGEIPMTCTVNSGTVIFAQINATYSPINNPVFSPEELAVLRNPASTPQELFAILSAHAVPAFSAEEIATLQSTDPAMTPIKADIIDAHGVSYYVSSGTNFGPLSYSDCRNDVTINGVPTTPDHSDYPSTWWWKISDGTVLGYNLDVGPSLV